MRFPDSSKEHKINPKIEEAATVEAPINVAELLVLARVRGAFDFYNFKASELKAIKDWYQRESSSLPPAESEEILEQLLAYDLVSDHEVLNFIRMFPREEKEKLGVYLGRSIETRKYLQSFYELWEFMPYEEKERLRDHYTRQDPKNAIVVAPFSGRLYRPIIKKGRNERGQDQYVTILDEYFTSYDTAQELITNLLELQQRKVEEAEQAEVDLTQWDLLSYRRPGETGEEYRRRLEEEKLNGHLLYSSNIKAILENLDPRYLLPHLKRLKELKLLSPGISKEISKVINNPFYSKEERFATTEEKERRREILADIAKIKPPKKNQDLEYLQSYEAPSLGHAHELSAIHDANRERFTRNFLGNFDQYADLLTEPKPQFLLQCLDNGIPIYLMAESLRLTKKEVASLLANETDVSTTFPFYFEDLRDIKALLDFNLKHQDEPGPDLEKIIAKKIIDDIIDFGTDGIIAGNTTLHLEKILDYFQAANRQAIINAINKYQPQQWLWRLDLALKFKVLPIKTIIETAIADDYFFFLNNYHRLVYYLRGAEDSDVDLSYLRQRVRQVFEAHPEQLLSPKYQQVIKENFSGEEREDSIEKILAAKDFDQDFLENLSKSEYKGKYLKKIRDFFLHDPEAFTQIFAENFQWQSWEILLTFIPLKDALRLLIKNIENIDLINLVKYHSDFLGEQLAQHPHYQDQLISALEKSKQPQLLSFLLDEIQGSIRVKKREGEEYPPSWDALQRKFLSAYQAALEKDNLLIYQAKGLEVEGIDHQKYIKDSIEEYAQLNPEILLKTSYHQHATYFVIEKIIGSEKFKYLLLKHIKFISSEASTKYVFNILPPDIQNAVKVINPLVEIVHQKKLANDFYSLSLPKLKSYLFYRLYGDRLEKIAQEELELYGPRTNMEYYSPRDDFLEMAKTIGLLENSPLALNNREFILELGGKEGEELVKLLKKICLADLDTDLKAEVDFSKLGYEGTRQYLNQVIISWTKMVFGLETVTEEELLHADGSLLSAMIVYLQRKRENRQVEDKIKKFLSHLFSDNYPIWRAWGIEGEADINKPEALDQLKSQELLPQKITLRQYETWLAEEDFELDELLEYSLRDITSGIKSILEQAVIDGHIKQEDIDVSVSDLEKEYKALMLPLRTLTERQKELQALFKRAQIHEGEEMSAAEAAEYEEIKKQIANYSRDNRAALSRIQGLKYLRALKDLKAKDLASLVVGVDEKEKVALKKVFTVLEEAWQKDFPDFTSDIKRIRQLVMDGYNQIYGGEKVSRSKLSLTDRVDIKAYFLIGEEPVPSCQSYDSGGENSHGLLSYLLDPNVKIIQVYNEEGKIIARSILRLLADENNEPQLFLERVYSLNAHHKINEAILELARRKARAMGVGLFSVDSTLFSEDSSTQPEIKALVSRSSRASHVYSDAGRGLAVGGRFKIRAARRLD